jgi:hypothetical protein
MKRMKEYGKFTGPRRARFGPRNLINIDILVSSFRARPGPPGPLGCISGLYIEL